MLLSGLLGIWTDLYYLYKYVELGPVEPSAHKIQNTPNNIPKTHKTLKRVQHVLYLFLTSPEWKIMGIDFQAPKHSQYPAAQAALLFAARSHPPRRTWHRSDARNFGGAVGVPMVPQGGWRHGNVSPHTWKISKEQQINMNQADCWWRWWRWCPNSVSPTEHDLS